MTEQEGQQPERIVIDAVKRAAVQQTGTFFEIATENFGLNLDDLNLEENESNALLNYTASIITLGPTVYAMGSILLFLEFAKG